ncbi:MULTISPECIES: ATP-dependent nuclease [Clostridia]|uniref:ATP-dependent nuclease n=2 Tax=Bacillota TaxID=1239 RepID=UPI001412BA74|nr:MULTISPECIES: AAA family ATPase [Eubacteriales]NBJ88545.1 ATP-dependent endonuclease [Acutalibacter sp. 1XD8-36]
MAIDRIKICNFKSYKGIFELKLNKGLNILVGNNETGKSTILEAIHLALTGMYGGRNIRNELSQYLFNREVIAEYIESVNRGTPLSPPEILIEIFFEGSLCPEFEGNNNTERLNKVEGLQFRIFYNDKYNDEYAKLIALKKLSSLPIEYYDVSWISFARQAITIRSIPIKSAMIDSSNYRYQNGSDVYISRIVKDLLSPEEVTSVAQAHRNMRDEFMEDPSIQAINDRISKESSIIDGEVSLSVDLGTKNAWENSLVTQLNNIPFGYVGKGAQCVMKTELALTHKQVQNASIILLEEPESHLSFSKLNQLISSIESKYGNKQIIISTHSSFVANKLGLENLLLLDNHNIVRIAKLDSAEFFKRIAGYDTLRLILCKKAILVEGDSDELVVQKAYMCNNNGRLPIQDGIDVISVGTSFLRFLELASILNKKVSVVTDNDGDPNALKTKYSDYLGDNKQPNINICYDETVDTGTLKIGEKNYNYNTLEPKLLKANSLNLFNLIFGTQYANEDDLRKYMKHNKTECAMAIFNTSETIVFPNYIMEAISDNE